MASSEWSCIVNNPTKISKHGGHLRVAFHPLFMEVILTATSETIPRKRKDSTGTLICGRGESRMEK